MHKTPALLILALLAGCSGAGIVAQPADPAATARIVAACTASGLFKAVDGAFSAAVPAAAMPVMAVNAGVDIVCRDPARFAADLSTAEWVAKNLAAAVRAKL
jgi:hypothetical protein